MAAPDALEVAARRLAAESAVESAVPIGVLGTAFTVAWGAYAEVAVSRPATAWELVVGLGALAAISGWTMARQLRIAGERRPWRIVVTAMGLSLVLMAALAALVTSSFASRCGELGGEILEVTPTLCARGPVPGNPYLPAAVLAPAWDGALPPFGWVGLGLVAALSALGLREQRIGPTRLVEVLHEALRLAPAAGAATVLPGPPKDGAVVACGNPTLWGQPCGQLYAADQLLPEGSWCVRCQQAFRPAERSVRLSVVSLFTDEIDVLNGLERLDAVSWAPGQAPPPDPRLSGAERWVRLGEIVVPEVLSVAQVLALIHDRLDGWAEGARREAAQLAARRASRICAWMWFGRQDARLTFASPTRRVRLVMGTTSLAEVVAGATDELVLQLDIGLLPVEVRSAFRRTFLEEGRAPEVQNTRADVWIPVGPPGAAGGLWVDRLEGHALRRWLSTDRLQAASTRGVTVPMPYRRLEDATSHVDDPALPDPGSLDLVVCPLTESGDAARPEGAPARLSAWDWLPPEQIQALRRNTLVLTADDAHRGAS